MKDKDNEDIETDIQKLLKSLEELKTLRDGDMIYRFRSEDGAPFEFVINEEE